jgi:hypothetical protein
MPGCDLSQIGVCKMTNQQPFEFNIAPLMKMYAESIEAWKKNYESLAGSVAESAKPVHSNTSPFASASAPASSSSQPSYDASVGTWQKSGEELFKRLAEQQIEMTRFFVSRWEHFLKLPAQLAQCRTPVEATQVQAAFLSEFANEFMQESQKLAQPVGELMSHWSALRPG